MGSLSDWELKRLRQLIINQNSLMLGIMHLINYHPTTEISTQIQKKLRQNIEDTEDLY